MAAASLCHLIRAKGQAKGQKKRAPLLWCPCALGRSQKIGHGKFVLQLRPPQAQRERARASCQGGGRRAETQPAPHTAARSRSRATEARGADADGRPRQGAGRAGRANARGRAGKTGRAPQTGGHRFIQSRPRRAGLSQ